MSYRYAPLPPANQSWFRRTRYLTRMLRVSPGSGDDPLRGTLDVINITSKESPYEALSLQPAGDENKEGGGWSESVPDHLDTSLPHLVALAQRPYFERTWGIQEVVVAKDVVLKCEDLGINFDHLLGSWNHIAANVEGELGPNNSVFSMWMAMLATRKATAGALKPLVPRTIGPLSLTLDLSRPYLSTDPRDKIFSVLGICWEGVRPGHQQFFALDYLDNWGVARPLMLVLCVPIKLAMLLYSPSRLQMPKELQPDYQKTTAEVYTTFARFLIEHQAGHLGILNNVSHIEDPEDGEYPSWVPKWFEPKREINMAEDFKMGYYRAFSSMATTRGASFSKKSEQPHILCLDGYTFDVADAAADVFRFKSEEFDDTFGGIVGAWYELFDSSFVPRSGETYYDGQPLDVAFLKAISVWPKGDADSDITQKNAVGFNHRILNGYFNMDNRAEDKKGFNAEIYMWYMAIIIREAEIREECGIASDQDEDEDEMRRNVGSGTSSFTADEITQAGPTPMLDGSASGPGSKVVSDTDGNPMDSIGPANEIPSAEQESDPFLQFSGLEKARAIEVEPYTFAYEDIDWDDLENLSEAYPKGLYQTAHNRRAFTTSDGFIGLGPSRMKPGDQVVALFGSELPSILRPRPQGGFYLIGQAYILHEELRSGSLTQSVASGNGRFSRNTYDIY
ncbi:unnamed protein product [Clonostachys solani]|uniref:Uncharacterized protein n=1 Tax=Clonostachys solani TaxID=160281 RepID=A0A9P0EJ74_9HYPO|nr:unnamed protein product [Clonostachys solani]